jgi:hypothetical protein
LAITPLLAPLAAQDNTRTAPATPQATPEQEQQERHRLIHLEDMLGAEVVLKAVGEAQNEREDRPTVEVSDLVIDQRSGDVCWALLDVGDFLGIAGRTVAVPIGALDCRPQDRDDAWITMTATRKQLMSLPAFDAEAAGDGKMRDLLQTAEASFERSDITVHDADGSRSNANTGKHDRPAKNARGEAMAREGSTSAPRTFALASDLDEYAVHTDGEQEFGNVSEVFLRAHGAPSIAFVVVSSGGVVGIGDTQYLVPYQALSTTKKGEETTWKLDKTKQEMEGAPEWTKPEKGFADAETQRKARRFYGVTASDDDSDGSQAASDDGRSGGRR